MEKFDISEKIKNFLFSEIRVLRSPFMSETEIRNRNESDKIKLEIISEFERLNKENEFLIETNKGLNEADNNKARTILELNQKIKTLEESNDKLITGLANIGKSIFNIK